jgi:hypothetical protein
METGSNSAARYAVICKTSTGTFLPPFYLTDEDIPEKLKNGELKPGERIVLNGGLNLNGSNISSAERVVTDYLNWYGKCVVTEIGIVSVDEVRRHPNDGELLLERSLIYQEKEIHSSPERTQDRLYN